MAFLPGIFGNGNKQPQQPGPQGGGNGGGMQQPQNQQQPINGNGSGGPAGRMEQPANSQMQPGGNQNPGNGQNGQGGGSSLDAFFQLMTPSKEVQQQHQQRQQQMSAPLFGDMTPEKMQEQISKTSFTQNINPEAVQKALGGDQQSFMDVLNQVAQNAFSSSLQMSKGMVEHGVNTGSERFSSTLDSRFRDLQLKNKNSENPALQHPIGQALLGTIKQQIASANPRMNADQVHAKAEEMFSEFGKMLNPSQTQQGQEEQSSQQNWLSFLDPEQVAQGQ